MRTKSVVAVISLGRVHYGVDRADDGSGVAAGVVATEQIAVQRLLYKSLRSAEHLRLSTPKAINTLLGVAH